MRRLFGPLLLWVIVSLSSCRDREEQALVALDDEGYTFSVADYHEAAEQGNLEAVQGFLRAGMAVDVEGEDGLTAFQRAASKDRDEVARWLITNGAAPDQRLHDGRTLLMRVAERESTDLSMLEFLLLHHADPQAVDGAGMTPLMVAAMAGHVDAVRRLARLDVRSLDRALMLSAAQGHTHCMGALIQRGAYVNCRSRDDRTPLIYAASKGHAEALQLLLQHHANRFATGEDGRTAADFAEASGYPHLAEILRDPATLVLAGPTSSPHTVALSPLDGEVVAFLSESVVSKSGTEAIEPQRPPVPGRTDTSAEDAEVAVAKKDEATVVDLEQEMVLGVFEERFEPFLVTRVQDDQAQVRLLDRPWEDAVVTVMVGETIPDTAYTVTQLTRKEQPGKGGITVDVSEVLAQRTTEANPENKRFVRGALPRDQTTHLVVGPRRSGRQFAARVGDVFAVAENGETYRVDELRPHQLILRELSSGRVLTVQRR